MARILFIDDDPFTLETLTKAVQIFGHHALLAETGEKGLSLATQDSPDLIFVDLGLPDMDGLALVRRLVEEGPTTNIPVYVLSANPELDVVDRVRAAGARAYLNKPIRLQTLMEIINNLSPG